MSYKFPEVACRLFKGTLYGYNSLKKRADVSNSLRRALTRVSADPEGKNSVFWTSLREVRISVTGRSAHLLKCKRYLGARPLRCG